jgi:hypothetical protein
MAKAKLKVFRTAIGFHDAYVAAPSQKAALEAWGSDANLFARGQAERVEDKDLIAEPLADPGRVIKRLRGTEAEQFAALAPDKPRTKPAKGERPRKVEKKRPPRPSRSALDAAEEQLAAAERRHERDLERIAAEAAKIAARRRKAETARDEELAQLGTAVDEARREHERRLDAWRAG